MATFTHRISWRVVIDGYTTTYSFETEVDNVTNVQAAASDTQTLQTIALAQEPAFLFFLNKSDGVRGSISLAETSGPSSVSPAILRGGEVFTSHLSDAGGTWNSSGSDATTTLKSLDSVSVGGTGNRVGNYQLLILHQASS